jgi:hypothetical protein
MKRPLKFPLKFSKGIIFVTGKRTEREAMKPFKDFYFEMILQYQKARGVVNEALARKQLKENIEAFRENGFDDQQFLERMRADFINRPRRAPRKKIKRAVDANKIPKVTKTPLDPQISALFAWEKRRRAEEKVQ